MSLSLIELMAAEAARERDASLASAPARRRAHGIVHTPAELARLVVRESDRLLREQLGLDSGVCAPALALIDPACGPGAFFAAALAVAEAHGGGELHGWGCDLDEAALVLARRLQRHPAARGLEFECSDALASDALLRRVSAHAGPLLVLGNPPWATARAQPTPLDQSRLEAFRRERSGERLPERKLGVLSDAYVRFFALCAELALHARGGAVVALVSNGSYLDGPVHRGMRARLLEWFDDVRVLDLGGSALLGRSRQQRDDNVFGVRPSVAITWLCRRVTRASGTLARVSYARLHGSRVDKLQTLMAADAPALGFAAIEAEAPGFQFVPRPRRDVRYDGFPSLDEWQPFNREGVQSNRDLAVIADDTPQLLERLRAFVTGRSLPALAAAERALPHYDPALARRRVAEALERDPDGRLGLTVQPLTYRPFDDRVFCPIAPLCHRPRPELAQAFARAAAALVSVRKDRGDLPWTHSAFARHTVDNCYFSTRSSCRTRAFPALTADGQPNLAPHLADRLAESIGEPPNVHRFQHYALCLMSAACYRVRWDAELHQDYPRIPLPETAAQFRELSSIGEQLASLYSGSLVRGTDDIAELPLGARVGDLDIATGSLQLQGRTLCELTPDAARLSIGHHRPVWTYLASHASRSLDRSKLLVVVALAQRTVALDIALRAADRAVAAAWAHFL